MPSAKASKTSARQQAREDRRKARQQATGQPSGVQPQFGLQMYQQQNAQPTTGSIQMMPQHGNNSVMFPQVGSSSQHSTTTTTTTTSSGQTYGGQSSGKQPQYVVQQPTTLAAQQQGLQWSGSFAYGSQQATPLSIPQPVQQALRQAIQQNTMPQPLQQAVQQAISQIGQQATPQPAMQSVQQTQSVQQGFDYTHLAQTPTAAPTSSFDYTQLAQMPMQPAQQSSQITTTSTTTTMGGAARQAAAAQGQTTLTQFDQTVQQKLQWTNRSICKNNNTYYRCKDGYLCGGGSHFISHDEVDNMMKYGRIPQVEYVNAIRKPSRWIAPPAEGWHEPMHWSPEQCIANKKTPMPIKYDGTPWDMSGRRVQEALRRDAESYRMLCEMLGHEPDMADDD